MWRPQPAATRAGSRLAPRRAPKAPRRSVRSPGSSRERLGGAGPNAWGRPGGAPILAVAGVPSGSGAGPPAASRGLAGLPWVTGAPGDAWTGAGLKAEARAAPGPACGTERVPGGPAGLGGEDSYPQGPGSFLAGRRSPPGLESRAGRGEWGGGDGGGNCGGRGEAAELGGSRRPALVPAAGARSEGWRRDPDQGPGPRDEDADAWRPAAEAGPAVRWAEWKPRRPGVSGPCCSRLVLPRLALPARSGVGQPGGGQARPQMGSRGQDLTQFLNQICPQAQPWLRCLQEEARFLCSSQGVPLQDQGVPTQR